VVKGTAHEAFLKAFFRDCIMQAFDTAEQAREAVMAGKADLVFDDGVSLAFWIAGTGSKACCELRGGPFQEPRYFGDGVGVAIRKGDQELKRLINIAIKRVRESGQYQEIARRYFPRFYAAELERP
jgi:polar amino acid transport system substrate-binding protein